MWVGVWAARGSVVHLGISGEAPNQAAEVASVLDLLFQHLAFRLGERWARRPGMTAFSSQLKGLG
jgi:hypothetical protein